MPVRIDMACESARPGSCRSANCRGANAAACDGSDSSAGYRPDDRAGSGGRFTRGKSHCDDSHPRNPR